MRELYEAALLMPMRFWVLMGTVVVLVIWCLWFANRRPNNLSAQFYDHWIKRINRELRECRAVPRVDNGRKRAYERTFSKLYQELSDATGSPANFNHMPTAERSVWIHLLTRIRDVQYFN